jgi:hypothetical protein
MATSFVLKKEQKKERIMCVKESERADLGGPQKCKGVKDWTEGWLDTKAVTATPVAAGK